MMWMVLSSFVHAHSGGTDAYGCHAGSQPYHCHGATHINFDGVDIQGEIVKPSIQYVQEEIRVDPCDKYAGTDTWMECSLNLSYQEITSLCEMTRTNPTAVKAYLDTLVKTSLMETIYESTGENGWQYRYHPDEDYYVVINSPRGKWNGKKLRTGTKGYDNVYRMHSEMLADRISTVPSSDYEGKQVTIWQSCSSNGRDVYDEHWYTQVRDQPNEVWSEFVAWPVPVGTCEEGHLREGWGRGGSQKYCNKFAGPMSMERTIYTKNPANKHQSVSHNFTTPVGMIVSPDIWTFEENGTVVLPISTTMFVVVNNETKEFGILYRSIQMGNHTPGGDMVFHEELPMRLYRESQEAETPPTVVKPENPWIGPLAIATFIGGMIFIINQHGGF